MTNVVFAKTRHEYASYRDFWRVVELSGYPIRHLDEIDWQQPITVIATPKNGEWEGIPTQKRARLIWWNIERVIPSAPLMDMANPFRPSNVDEVWASDAAMARYIGAKYVFLGGHKNFGSADFRDKRYDVITLMAPMPRRGEIFEGLKAFSCADTGSLWGEERHHRLMQSRIMVMAHQDGSTWCEPPRMMIGGCYGLPMVCESSEDSGLWKKNENYFGVDLPQMIEVVRVLLDSPLVMAQVGAAAYQTAVIDHPFRREVEAAL